MSYKTFTLNITDSIATITFNRPEQLNSLNVDFWSEFPEAIVQIDKLASARVLVIKSQGKHFCAGMDLAVFDNLVDKQLEEGRSRLNLNEKILSFQSILSSVEQLRIPVIGAIQGACVGGGVALASICDMRYCTEDAFFSIEEINVGVACDIGTLQRLPFQISETHLREWVYTGDRLPAHKAAQWGFVGEVYTDKAQMDKQVFTLAKKIASKSPLALHGCKASMNYNRDHTVKEGLEHVALWNSAMLREYEIGEALAARKEKRKGEFFPLPAKV